MQKNSRHEIAEDLLLRAVTVVGLPGVADGESVETQHIGDGHLADCGAEQVGALIRADAHQEAAVAATFNDQSIGLKNGEE